MDRYVARDPIPFRNQRLTQQIMILTFYYNIFVKLLYVCLQHILEWILNVAKNVTGRRVIYRRRLQKKEQTTSWWRCKESELITEQRRKGGRVSRKMMGMKAKRISDPKIDEASHRTETARAD